MRETEGEWRDPEDGGSAMPIQGISTQALSPKCIFRAHPAESYYAARGFRGSLRV